MMRCCSYARRSRDVFENTYTALMLENKDVQQHSWLPSPPPSANRFVACSRTLFMPSGVEPAKERATPCRWFVAH